MTRRKLLEKAISIVCEDRNQQYGGPENTFKDIAALWAAYLDEQIGPEDVAIMMILMKVARLKASSYQSGDSWVDIAGYAACGSEIAIGKEGGFYQC
jgi:hypothetical protein